MCIGVSVIKTIEQLLDTDHRVTRWPGNTPERILVLQYLASKFDTAAMFHEREVNEILKRWHTFSDWSGLRRELVDNSYLTRNKDGTQYKRLLSLPDFFADDTLWCRPYIEADTANLVVLVNKAYSYQDGVKGAQRTDQAGIRKYASKSNLFVFVDTKSGTLAGCVALHLQPEDNYVYFGLLTIDTAYAGNGIGAKIIQSVDTYARYLNATGITLNYMHLAPWLKVYYESFGFKETGDIEESGKMNLVKMNKVISPK